MSCDVPEEHLETSAVQKVYRIAGEFRLENTVILKAELITICRGPARAINTGEQGRDGKQRTTVDG